MLLDRRLILTLAVAWLAAGPACAEPMVGQPAPAFQARDADGRTVSLAQFRGRTVVLEWTNNGCPYVGKHYGSGNMQRLQAQATADGVAWLTIISSAPGFQGYLTGPQAKAWKAKVGARSSDVLLDPKGVVGRLYEARTTPHMFVIDKTGRLVYMGGVDDQPTTDPESLKIAKPYLAEALADVKAGRPVATPVSQPYGCSVKYGSAE
ncbi:MAG: thioredoxin family protein [Caulobacterales bacterium]|nr:thioredoxin family protein [Caulobacterales bacterium]